MRETSKQMTRQWCRSSIFFVFVISTAISAASDVADSVTAVSASPIAVDMRTDECQVVGQTSIGYSPLWGGITNAGAFVVLQKVVAGVTNTVVTFAADEADSYSYELGSNDPCFVRMIHRVYSSDGIEIGEPLVSDIAFGYRSAAGTPFIADSRTNSLQEVVNSGDILNLTYSTSWAMNAKEVSIKAVQLSRSGGDAVATNDVFVTAADAEGVVARNIPGSGWWRLLCQLSDSSDDVLVEYYTDEFKVRRGFILTVR